MTEQSTYGFIIEQRNPIKARGRRATVRSAVNRLAQRQSIAPRQAVRREAGLPVLWLMRAAQCDSAAAALAIKTTRGSAIGSELLIPGNVFRRFTKTTDRTIVALERLRMHGLVSWKQVGDGFKVIPHLH